MVPATQQFQPEATLLAFDYGMKRIGVAVGNTVMQSARALTTLANRDRMSRFAQIEKLLAEWQPQRLVVGLPTHPDGAEHAMTQQCRRFANQLHGRFNLPVILIDERYSSVAAAANGERDIDAESARIILQQYFDEPPLAVVSASAISSTSTEPSTSS